MLLLVGLMLVAGILLYFFRAEDLPMPRCPFLSATGWQCPGCGSMRGVHALLHGRISEAWRLNALLMPGLIYLIWLIVLESLRPFREWAEKLYRIFSGGTASWITLTVIVLWGVVRNLI